MLNLWCDLHLLPMLVLAIPTFIPFFRNDFFTCSCRFFLLIYHMKYQLGLNHMQEDDETTLQVYTFF